MRAQAHTALASHTHTHAHACNPDDTHLVDRDRVCDFILQPSVPSRADFVGELPARARLKLPFCPPPSTSRHFQLRPPCLYATAGLNLSHLDG